MAASLSLQTRAAHLIAIERLKPRPITRAALVPLALGLIGLALWLAGHLIGPATPAQTSAPAAPSLTSTAGQGDIPFIGDPIHDLTIWYSNMISFACQADIGNLKGHFLTPLDPMSDQTVIHLYGQILLITIRLITMGEAQVNLHLAPLHRIALAKLTPNDVRNLVRRLLDEGLSPRSAGYVLVILRMALRQAVADRLLGRNVATYVDLPRREQVEIQPLSPLQARQLVAAAREDPRGALWTVLLGTGLRLGEALGLRRADVDLEEGRISVRGALRPQPLKLRGSDPRLALVETKTAASRRTLAAPGFVLEALRQHQARSADVPANVMNLVFTTPRGTPIDPRNANRQFGEFLRRNELPHIRVHDLRHTAASLLLAQGFTLEDVKRYLGHSSIVQTSNTYGHLVAGRSAEVAAGMDRAVTG